MTIPERFTCIIAARYKSSRFMGKPLHFIHGKPMVVWVAEHATKAKLVKEAIVATDDKRIYDVVIEAGYKAVYTSEECPNGSARVAEVAEKLDEEWIFEMQGDQPMVTPGVIDDFLTRSVAEVEKNNQVEVVIPFAGATAEQTKSSDILKVVVTASNRLVFQTRHPIETGYRTLGLYLWKREALLDFANGEVSHIEEIEDSHPIRLYVNDVYVQGVEIHDTSWVEVDRPHHADEVEKLMVEKGIV